MATTHQRVRQDHPTLACATLTEAFQQTAARDPDAVALRTPDGTVSITWAQYAARVEGIAGALAGLGVGHGDTVAIMLLNRPEFHLVDTAAMHLGATPFSLYNTSPRAQVEDLLANAGSRVIVTEDAFLPVVDGLAEHVVLVDELEALQERAPSDFHFEQTWRAVEPDDVLTLIYTSGTTGPPKGVQLTHANMMAELRGCSAVLPVVPGGRVTSFLPSAHIADRWFNHYYGSMAFGCTITSVADPRTIVAHLPGVRPTVWGAVPRVWEKIEAALRKQGIDDPAALPDEAKAGVRAKLGLADAAWLISGAAPIAVETLEYFMALGMPIQELWGMSETSCCVTINPRDAIKVGTCGPPIPGATIELADDGELLVRGELVMAGYRGDPQRSAEAIDDDGWLHTGDVATLDEDGYLTIVDRKKDLIINAAGKNMSPANIEQRLKAAHPLIGQAVVVGDRRPYNVALLVLDPDACAAYAADERLPGSTPQALAVHPEVQAELTVAVDAANEHLSRVERIKRFKVLADEWLPGGEELTPTMKLKRRPIAIKYAAEIERLYAA